MKINIAPSVLLKHSRGIQAHQRLNNGIADRIAEMTCNMLCPFLHKDLQLLDALILRRYSNDLAKICSDSELN